jgi:hypothetical protein
MILTGVGSQKSIIKKTSPPQCEGDYLYPIIYRG